MASRPLPESEWTSDLDVVCSSGFPRLTLTNDVPMLYRAAVPSTIKRALVVCRGQSFNLPRWGFSLWALQRSYIDTYDTEFVFDPLFGGLVPLGLPAMPETIADDGFGRRLGTVQGGGVDPIGTDPYEPGDTVLLEFDIQNPVLSRGDFVYLQWQPDITVPARQPTAKAPRLVFPDPSSSASSGDPPPPPVLQDVPVLISGSSWGCFFQIEVWRGVR